MIDYSASRWHAALHIDVAIPAGAVKDFPEVKLQHALDELIEKTIRDFLDRQGILHSIGMSGVQDDICEEPPTELHIRL